MGNHRPGSGKFIVCPASILYILLSVYINIYFKLFNYLRLIKSYVSELYELQIWMKLRITISFINNVRK